MTIIPAYGRDYKSRKAAISDLEADKDFIIADYGNPYDTKPINLSQIKGEKMRSVTIRYNQLRRVTVYDV